MRMHDLCGALLFYCATHDRLPATLDGVQAAGAASGAALELVCPVSGRRYLYDPTGTLAGSPMGRVVLADATPAHDGRRWGVAVTEPQAGGPLLARVISLPAELSAGKTGGVADAPGRR